ncbi:MAG TPA: GGDEF domain-containing protein, partial [Candidatus Dormibacteraeota bacterium]|nr:GGDEF domain-containing protein [Candidatus Dormibacteraeota bacterium]
RASQRRRVFDAARLAMLIVAAVAFLDCATLTIVHPHAARTLVVLNVGLAGAALLVHSAITRLGPRSAEAGVWVITTAVTVSTVALGMLEPELSLLAAGYLLILPMVVPLIVPWRTRSHVVWLVGLSAVTMAYIASAPASDLRAYERQDLAVLLAVVAFVSPVGHVLGLRGQVHVFTQSAGIASLRRAEHVNLVALEALNRSLSITARTDELTGLGNRLRLVEDLRSIRASIERYGESYALVELDLDRFKRINDTLGHVEGDGILRAVASAILATLRGSDSAYRYGGEEFIVIARVASDAHAIALAERFRAAVEGLAINHPDNPASPRVTVSAGAIRITRGDLEADERAWLAGADRALYRAKDAGRNCVRFAGPIYE